MAATEKADEVLKQQSREWWSKHSQDYVAPGEVPHLGVPLEMSDGAFLEYLDRIDANFKADAYFAQSRGAPLFSGLIPTEWLAGKRVLEIGCGLGAHTEVLCRGRAKVDSIDLSPTSVEVTKRRLVLRGLRAAVQQADAEALPFPDESFDYIWSWGVIHHSPDAAACAQEISRVLRPGGRLGIMLYNRNSIYNWINVIFRYGILRGELRKMSIQELHSRYTDGKERTGAPLSKYYTRRVVREVLFPTLQISRQRCFEQKHAATFFIPARWRRRAQAVIPDRLHSWLWNRAGFLLFSEGWKPAPRDHR